MAESDLCVVYWLFNERCVCLWRHGYIGYSQCWPAPLKRHRRNGVPFSNWMILFRGTKRECRDIEWKLRPHSKIGWNCAPGGGHLHRLGAAISPATKKLLSDINKNRPPISDATRDKMRTASTGKTNRGRTGQKKSNEERQRISLAHQGKRLSAEHNAKLQASRLPAAHTGHRHSDEAKNAISQKKIGVAVHSEEHKQRLAERWKGNTLTKDRPWSAARRLAWLKMKENHHANFVRADS